MPLAVETIVKQLTDSGIVVEGKLANFVPPKAQPKDGEALLRDLYKQNLLTKFQAQQVAAGRAKSLIMGNYVILDKIGAGGMGQVFKAEHRRMKRLVAIKTLPAALTKDAAALARFQREVEAAAKLRHTNIVAADDADEANGLHFLVMEYIDGRDLSAFVKWNGPLSVEEAVNFTLQAAKGLAFAHQKGIVHRDIKPANLLVDGEGTVKILDMGLARIASSGDASSQAELTGTGTVMGTVDYMAPEQAVDTKTADARADIYALGCSLFFLLTGKATYQGDTLMKKVLAHREHPIPRLRSFCPEAPEQLEGVFTKMVAKRLVDRYQTMTEVIAALEGCNSRQSHTLALQSSDAGQTIQVREESVSSGPTYIAAPNTRSGGQSHGSSTAKSVESSEDVNLAEFLDHLPTKPSLTRKPATKPVANRTKTLPNDRKKLLLIGVAVLGMMILLAGMVINMKTKSGDATLVVTVNEPGAEVQVLNEKDTVEITRKSDKGPITITVVPGKHRLKVQKDGFEIFADSFEIRSGNTESIAAKLVPLEKAAIAVGKPWEKAAVAVGKPWESPAFRQWVKDVQDMPAEKQVEALRKKLKELNPEFDGKISSPWIDSSPPIVEEGNVVELKIVGDKLGDLSPIRALSELRHLVCVARQIRGEPLDLSPLHGMKIRALNCGGRDPDLSTVKGLSLSSFQCIGGNITDLAPLSGVPLKYLTVSGNWEIKSLEPLKGMPLTGLACDNCQVADLSPLRGMQLTYLVCHVTKVADLSPLKGMPLEELNCEQTPVKDFSPLAGMKLKRLSFTPNPELKGLEAIRRMDSLVEIGTAQYKLMPSNQFWKQYDEGVFKPWESPAFQQWVKDVQGMPAEKQVEAVTRKLKELNPGFDGKLSAPWNESSPAVIQDGKVVEVRIFGDRFADLSPIRALSELRRLECWATQDTGEPLDLSPLNGMKIRTLSCFGRHPDLSMVKDVPLSELGCIGGRLTDLTALSGAPLKSLGVSGNWEIKSLEPLKGMPLTGLACDNCQVADLWPLRGMSLTYLVCHVTNVADLSPLKGMPLETLNCDQTPVKDLSPLAGMKLKRLTFTPNPELKGLQAIRQMDSLLEIGTAQDKMISSSEFWKKYDAGEFAK
ncbi:MAG TPA: serine/threonine-protein kinase [Pirellulales bacterium]|jgi:serine/threonine protein kinase|nr:serine/threonine-protein kinase [Pirellulales bacterium]